MSGFSAFTELHGHRRERRAVPSPGLTPPPPKRDEADAGRLSAFFCRCAVCLLCVLLHVASGVAASAVGSFPSARFQGPFRFEVSGLCSCYCQVVLGPVTTALWNRPSVVDLRVVLGDVFRGQHDRNEFFGCLWGRGWEGYRWIVLASQQAWPPRDERGSGEGQWTGGLAFPGGVAVFGEVTMDAEPDGGWLGILGDSAES